MPALREIWIGADGSIPAYVTIKVVAMNTDGTPNNSLDGTHVLINKAASFSDKTISGISQASPAVVSLSTPTVPVTVPDGSVVMHDTVVGMTQVNGTRYTAKNPAPGTPTSTYQLYTIDSTPVAVDSTGFGAYASGGVSHLLAKPSVNTLVHEDNNGTYSLVLDPTERDTLYYGYASFQQASLVAVSADFRIVPDDPNAAAPTLADIVNGVLDALAADHDIANTIGAKINASGGGGGSDPLLSTVPGSYAAGTAGAALGLLGNSGTTPLKANVTQVNNVAVVGDGSDGNPWKATGT